MGQCISIQVGPPNQTKEASHSQIANHGKKKGAKGERVRSSSARKKKLQRQDESSDAETTDDEQALHDKQVAMQVCDENFGKAQSPINIFTSSSSECCAAAMTAEAMKDNPLRINYPDLVRGCTIMNTGHTVQVNLPAHSKCTLFTGGKLYHLKQFHFHTPSEHMLDDKQFEMEMHLVHINEANEIAVLGFIFTTKRDYAKPTLALSKARKELIKQTKQIIMKFQNAAAYGAGAVALETNSNKAEHPLHQEADEEQEPDLEETVAGVVEAEQPDVPDWDDKHDTKLIDVDTRARGESVVPGNDFLDQFWAQLPLKKTEQDVRLTNGISFDYLFDCASKSFQTFVESNEIGLEMDIFEYPGSLTTPPFTEGVSWMVAKKTHFINVKQLNKLSSCWGHHNNARECQEYHGREVQIRSQQSMRGYFFN